VTSPIPSIRISTLGPLGPTHIADCSCSDGDNQFLRSSRMEGVSTPLAVPGQRPSMPVTIRLNDDMKELHVSDGHRSEKIKGSYIVVSGGTAANDFVQAFGRDCAFVLPGELSPTPSR
jgi:hypothetical protein